MDGGAKGAEAVTDARLHVAHCLLEGIDLAEMQAQHEPVVVGDAPPRRALGIAPSSPIDGVFARLGWRTAILYRCGDVLRIRIGTTDVALDESTRVDLARGWWRNSLTVSREGRPVLRVTYCRPWSALAVPYDPTPFVEEEHSDFGVLLRNVVADPERRARIYGEPQR